MEIIGEAVSNIPEKFRDNYPQIPWKKIVGVRNIVIGYINLMPFFFIRSLMYAEMNQSYLKKKYRLRIIISYMRSFGLQFSTALCYFHQRDKRFCNFLLSV